MMTQIELVLLVFNYLSPTNALYIGESGVKSPASISIVVTSDDFDMTV
jgi:hypothetical protein